MANPVFDFGRNEKADLNHSTFDLSKKEFFTGRIGELIPCYKNEVLAGDKVTIQPYLDIQMSPTIKTLKSKFKIVIDYFAVPFQAIWKNYPYFVNQGQNGVGQVPEIPYHSFPNGSTAVSHGSLFDYLGVPTLAPSNTTAIARYDLKKLYDVDKNNSAKESGFFFGLHANKEKHWNADNEGSKNANVEAYFNNVINAYKPVPLYVLRGLHTTDSLGVHEYEKDAPYGKISHSVAFGSQFITFTNEHDYTVDIAPAQRNANSDIKRGLITKPLSENASFRFVNSFTPVGGSNVQLPSTNNSFAEVIVMYDYAGRPQRYFYNSTNTAGVDQFTIEREYGNNSLGGDTPGGTITTATSVGRFNTTVFLLSADTINDINGYLLTENGKRGVSFGFYTFYDKAQSQLKVPHIGCWSLPLSNFYDSNAILTSVDFNYTDKKSFVSLNQSLASPSSPALVSPQNLIWYLGRHCSVPLVTSRVDNIDVLSTKPYAKDANGNIAIKLNAFYARAYECVYNYFYRNRVTDPLLDSQNRRVINQFLRDDYMNDGPDGHSYKLRHALLEKDRFTSCISADIINHTPLVGIRHASGDTDAVALTFSVDGEGHEIWVGEEDGQVKISKYSEGLPNGTLNVVKDTIKQGIALRDLQSVRQLQSWLHKHIECGYNFSDIQLATFGVNTKWNPNTAPKYLGGTVEIVDNGNIVSMAGDNMGERCGNPTAFSTHENTITHFVADPGVIIGIMRIVPEVVYTQMIDPLFIKHDYFDFYSPSFDNKGYESVTKGQMMPQLAYTEGKIDEVFGYNVPWSSYKFTQNEAHADARTTERDMLFYREFAQCPSLNKSFLECDPDDYDHIFRHISSLDDKFYASIFTKAVYSRPIGNPVDTI